MRRFTAVGAALLLSTGTLAQDVKPAVSPLTRTEQIIQALDLHPLAREGGLRGVIGRTLPEAVIEGKAMAVESRNYAMLTRLYPAHYLHRLESEETHILVEGGPVEVFILCPSGHMEQDRMSRNFTAGEDAVVPVPAGCWQAERLAPGVDYALMVSTQAPEWRSDRVRVGAGPDWVRRYTGKAPWATPELLRELIGPNWQP
ncbi:MAG: cupin domain-containing protein [Acidobacteriaceae bacterium]|nr:cupin domain-containing protein [Acidobacteriaceae bacterium]